ncbi:hypothetical protein BSKO_13737 [Bryopsis sp. KO-2023]|nr:hypothetical protein BSKO_13737 [Bryopsis sp. KO-2023]
MGQTQSSSKRHMPEKAETQPADLIGPNGRYKLGRPLSEGQFGKVRSAFDTLKKKEVAIKFIGRGPSLDADYVTREILNHRILCHPHVIGFKEVFLTDRALCIVMEYAAGGDMHDYMRKHKCLPEDWARWFFQQIILAIEYCHKRNVVLRDIKLENLLLDKHQQLVKLCDFGFSKHNQYDSAPQTCVGTPFYLAPEVLKCLKHKPYNGEKVDIWTCGVSLYAMLFGSYPFNRPGDVDSEQGNMVYYRRILEGKVFFPTAQKRNDTTTPISEGCVDLLKKMLEPSPSNRITLQEIKSHPWFLKGLPEGFIDYNKDAENIDENHVASTRKLQSVATIEKLVKEAVRPCH